MGKVAVPCSVLREHNGPVTALSFHSASTLISGDTTGFVAVWDIVSCRTRSSGRPHGKGHILSITHTPTDSDVITQSREGEVKVWPLPIVEAGFTAAPTHTFPSHPFSFCRAVSMPDTSPPLVITHHEENSVAGWDKRTDTISPAFTLHFDRDKQGMCMCVACPATPTQPLVAAGFESGEMVMWDTRNPTQSILVESFHTDSLTAMAWRDNMIVTGAADSTARILRLPPTVSTPLPSHTVSPPLPLSAPPGAIAIRPDNGVVAYGCWDNTVRVFQVRGHRKVAALHHHTASVHSTAFSPSGLLATGGEDSRVCLWDSFKIHNT